MFILMFNILWITSFSSRILFTLNSIKFEFLLIDKLFLTLSVNKVLLSIHTLILSHYRYHSISCNNSLSITYILSMTPLLRLSILLQKKFAGPLFINQDSTVVIT